MSTLVVDSLLQVPVSAKELIQEPVLKGQCYILRWQGNSKTTSSKINIPYVSSEFVFDTFVTHDKLRE